MKLKEEPKKSFQRVVQLRRSSRNNKETVDELLTGKLSFTRIKKQKKAVGHKRVNSSPGQQIEVDENSFQTPTNSSHKPIFQIRPVTILYSAPSGYNSLSEDSLDSDVMIKHKIKERHEIIKDVENIQTVSSETSVDQPVFEDNPIMSLQESSNQVPDETCNSSCESLFEFEPFPLCF